MSSPIITFTTDFGLGSPYVAEMKGVALTICPQATLVDITHGVPPQNVAHGAAAIAQAAFRFPEKTIHVGVVDPGVGTERKIIAARAKGHYFVAPDNGLLSEAIRQDSSPEVVELTARHFWLETVSATFHGRDIMTPVAAHLARGISLGELGPPVDSWCELSCSRIAAEEGSIRGEVLFVDSFGNVVTNIDQSDLGARQIVQVEILGEPTGRVVRTYGEANPGELIALFGSSGKLEVAVAMGNGAKRLDAKPGDTVHVQTAPQ